MWSVVRRLGLAMTPSMQLEFYRDALGSVAAGSRILVSGSADAAMLHTVVGNLRCDARTCQFTVVDLCPTPLALCERYARSAGLALRTEACDMLTYGDGPDAAGAAASSEPPTEGCFDVIATHAFLGYFDDATRLQLFRRWYALLAPGGRVVTVQRIRPGSTGERVGFSARQRHDFVESFLSRSELATPLGLDRATLEAMASTYCDCFKSHPIRSRAALTGPLTDCGFEVTLNSQPAGGTSASTVGSGGPSVTGEADFACIVATKRSR